MGRAVLAESDEVNGDGQGLEGRGGQKRLKCVIKSRLGSPLRLTSL